MARLSSACPSEKPHTPLYYPKWGGIGIMETATGIVRGSCRLGLFIISVAAGMLLHQMADKININSQPGYSTVRTPGVSPNSFAT